MNRDRLGPFFGASGSPMGDSLPYPLTLTVTPPSLVACLVHPSIAANAREIYRVAYENALASTRVSRFERAIAACSN